jgi:hypothetical protein
MDVVPSTKVQPAEIVAAAGTGGVPSYRVGFRRIVIGGKKRFTLAMASI